MPVFPQSAYDQFKKLDALGGSYAFGTKDPLNPQQRNRYARLSSRFNPQGIYDPLVSGYLAGSPRQYNGEILAGGFIPGGGQYVAPQTIPGTASNWSLDNPNPHKTIYSDSPRTQAEITAWLDAHPSVSTPSGFSPPGGLGASTDYNRNIEQQFLAWLKGDQPGGTASAAPTVKPQMPWFTNPFNMTQQQDVPYWMRGGKRMA